MVRNERGKQFKYENNKKFWKKNARDACEKVARLIVARAQGVSSVRRLDTCWKRGLPDGPRQGNLLGRPTLILTTKFYLEIQL